MCRLDTISYSEKSTKEGKQYEIKEHDFKSNYNIRMRMADDSIRISKMAFAQSMGGNRNMFYLAYSIYYSKRREIENGSNYSDDNLRTVGNNIYLVYSNNQQLQISMGGKINEQMLHRKKGKWNLQKGYQMGSLRQNVKIHHQCKNEIRNH